MVLACARQPAQAGNYENCGAAQTRRHQLSSCTLHHYIAQLQVHMAHQPHPTAGNHSSTGDAHGTARAHALTRGAGQQNSERSERLPPIINIQHALLPVCLACQLQCACCTSGQTALPWSLHSAAAAAIKARASLFMLCPLKY